MTKSIKQTSSSSTLRTQHQQRNEWTKKKKRVQHDRNETENAHRRAKKNNTKNWIVICVWETHIQDEWWCKRSRTHNINGNEINLYIFELRRDHLQYSMLIYETERSEKNGNDDLMSFISINVKLPFSVWMFNLLSCISIIRSVVCALHTAYFHRVSFSSF